MSSFYAFRKLFPSLLGACFLVASFFFPHEILANAEDCPGVGDLVITEIMQNPSAVGDSAGEWFEVYNSTGMDIDMMGMVIKDNGSDSHTIGSSVIVPAGGYAVLGNNADFSTNGGVNVDYEYSSYFLGNGDDEVIIECMGTIIDEVYYDGGPNFPDPTGASMSLSPSQLNATANDTGANWCEATSSYGSGDLGTPGQANDSCGSDPVGTSLSIAPDDAAKAEGNSGTTPFTFTVTRSGDTNGANDVNWAVTGSGGDPADATDFGGSLPSGTTMFATGETMKSITVNVSGDTDVEASEGFTVTLSNPTNGATITTGTADGTIQNDDGTSCPSPRDLVITEIMQNPSAVSDANGEYFEVYNSTAADIDMNGMLIKDNGSDSHTIGSSVIVPAGGYVVFGINADMSTNGGINVAYEYSGFNLSNGADEVVIECSGVTIDAVDYDGGPTFPDPTGASMNLDPTKLNATDNDDGDNWCESTSSFGAGDLGTPGQANDGCGTVQPATLAIAADDANKAEGNSGTTAFTFTVTRNGDVSGANDVDWAVTGSGSDPADADDFGGSLPSGTAMFAATETTKTISIDVSGDLDIEASEGFTVTLSNPTNGANITTGTADGNIQNDDGLSCPTVGDLVITEIMQNPDAVGDGSGEFFEVWNSTGSPINMDGMTIQDDGSDSHVISGSVIVPAGGFVVFGNNADFATNGGVNVDYEYSGFNLANGDDEVVIVCQGVVLDAVDYDGGPVFPDATGATMSLDPGSFNPTANDDGANWCEGLTPFGSGDLGTPGAANPACPDDPAELAIAPDDADKEEGDIGNTPFTFTVTRSVTTNTAVNVDWAVTGSGGDPANAADFGGSLPSGTVMFASGETTQSIMVMVSGDTDVEPNEGFSVTLSNPSMGATITTATADGNIQNDDCTLLNWYADTDGDGFGDPSNTTMDCEQPSGFVGNADDCDDTNGAINPNATEVCDGVDNNCNSMTDEAPAAPTTYYEDFDGDGFGNPSVTQESCAPPVGYVANADDCDDTNGAINPNADEVCDGVDNDCNGSTDVNPVSGPVWYADTDGDGFGDAGNSVIACMQPTGFVANDLDCNDTNGAINPNADEVCDGVDNDCDGETDEFAMDAPTWYEDSDGDGFGNQNVVLVQCGQPTGYVDNLLDCDDSDAAINPNTVWYVDFDGDGFGNPASSLTTCDPGSGYVLDNTDCDDNIAAINPNATEICDGIDNNCDGNIDEGVQTTYYQDMDGDGFGDAAVSQMACSAPFGFVENADDCDDTNGDINPNATEVCDGVDNNCDGNIDEGVLLTFYEDFDGDGFGNPEVTTMACSAPTGYVGNADDCDDTNGAVNPEADEICDGIDNDCDGTTDENPVTGPEWFADTDMDGFGDAENSVIACSQPAGFVDNDLDCDDTNGAINPNADEVCDGVDNDCDGETDEFAMDAPTWYEDSDGDGFGNQNVVLVQCGQPTGYVDNLLDCDDSDAAINPNATEVCDGIDNNCDGNIDEGVQTTYYQDMDGDGFGNAAVSQMACSAPLGYVENADDCDDTDGAVNPDAGEICNGIDDNCDGNIDEGVTTTFYADTDGDGYGDIDNTIQACDLPAGYVTNANDCDDTNGAVNPDATEICGNAIDDNCDGQVDEGCDCTIVSISVENISDCDDNGTPDPFDDTFTADVTVVFSSMPQTGTLDLSGDASASVWVGNIVGNSHTFSGLTMSADADAIMLTASFSADPTCILTNGNAGIAPGPCSGTCEVQILNVIAMPESCPGYGDGSITIEAIGSGQVGYSVDGGDNFQFDEVFTQLTPGTYDIVVQVFGTPTCFATTTATVMPPAPGSLMAWYQDFDNDGYSPGNTVQACERPTGFKLVSELTSTMGDCNDYDPTENVPHDWFLDADGDGFGEGSFVNQCERPVNHYLASELTAASGDCNDNDASIYPGAPEICNGIDDDCDGEIDEGAAGGLTYVGNVYLPNQAAVEAFSQCYSVIQGNLTIQNSGVNDLTHLINVEMVTGYVTIKSTSLTTLDGLQNIHTIGGYLKVEFNNSLTTLYGLQSVTSVGGYLRVYRNTNLTDCCAIYDLINNGGVGGSITISRNDTGCDNVSEINTACAGGSNSFGTPNGNAISSTSFEAVQSVNVYPNPMSDILTVNIAQDFETGTLEIFDLQGRLVHSRKLGAGEVQFKLSLGNLNSGTYLLHMLLDGENFSERLLVE